MKTSEKLEKEKKCKVSTFLSKTLKNLDNGDGWDQGSMGYSGSKTHCVLGAFVYTLEQLGYDGVLYEETFEANKLHKEARKFFVSAMKADKKAKEVVLNSGEYTTSKLWGADAAVPIFNDSHHTKFFDIKRVFKRAIAQAKTHERIAAARK